MDDAEREALAATPESDRVERNESARDKERLCQAVCAFANDLADHRKPGVIFVGVRDDGRCANLPITEELLRELAGLRTDHQILPFPNSPSGREPFATVTRRWCWSGLRRRRRSVTEGRFGSGRVRGAPSPDRTKSAA